MVDFLAAALDAADRLKVQAEVRFSFIEEEILRVKNLEPDITGYEQSSGIGVTVYTNGAYGFAATSILNRDSIEETVHKAYLLAKEQAQQRHNPIHIPTLCNTRAELRSHYQVDPFSIPASEKLETLMKVNQAALEEARSARILPVSMIRSIKKKLIYTNTSGAFISQELVHCGAEVQVYALSENEVQVRSYPSRDSSYYQKGYEVIHELDLINGTKTAVHEALELLKADEIEPGSYDAVISQDQMCLQVHESIGHPTELDRVLGFEISLAGGSFLKLEDRNKLMLAAPGVTIFSDATIPGANGSFFYDDEGTPAHKFPVISDGRLINFLSSRESAQAIGLASTGCARAESALRLPLVRMANLVLLPDKQGPSSLEEMISGIKRGVYLKTTRSWSIDDLRLNFQFAVEYAREIKNGKLGKVFKNVNYNGITPDFWKKIVVLGNENTYKLFGYFNCGKGDPIQLMTVGHGAPLALVKNLKLGVAR